jgi:hypothetical protein
VDQRVGFVVLSCRRLPEGGIRCQNTQQFDICLHEFCFIEFIRWLMWQMSECAGLSHMKLLC